MKYRRFGRTEILMPVFSCGGMRYQYKWQDVPLADVPADNQQNLAATIHRSLELGINHIETARYYGSSEAQLGQVLPEIDRSTITFQTKVPPTENPQDFLANFERSLSLLNLEYVDLLGIHGINNRELLEQTLRPDGCLAAAQELQRAGRVKHIGFSTHAPLEVIIQAIATDQFDYINLHWYYINQVNWPAIQAATDHDMGVFIISPTNKGGLLNNPSPRLVELCQPLSPIVFNDLFCLSHPQVHTLSIGAAVPSDFDEHLKTLAVWEQSAELLPPIIERLERAAIERLGIDWYHGWRQGLPEHQATPGNINIPAILWLRNLAIAYDMTEFGKMRYNLLENGGHWFPGAKALEVSQYDLTDCLSASPYADKIPEYLVDADRLLGGAAVQRLSQS